MLGLKGLDLDGSKEDRAYLRYQLAVNYENRNLKEQARSMIDEAIALDPRKEYLQYRDHLR